jgi:hypothetical protein
MKESNRIDMTRDLINTGQRFVAVLLLAIGPSVSGCKDTVSISDDVAVPLSSLTVTPGALQPGFFSNTTNYKVNAPTSATSVTVTASPKSSTVTMTINGVVTAAGQGRSVPLGAPGSTTTILIELLSQTGGETTYTITVTRLLSSDDNLSALSVKVGAATQALVPIFDANTLDYTVDVQTTVTSVTVTATKSDPNAGMLIGSAIAPPGTNPGQAPITLGPPGTITPVTIEVTAPNGSKKTYHLSIKRLSADNNLSVLSVSPGSLNPAFAASTPLYTVDVATNVSSVNISATKSDPNAVMAIGSVTVPAGTASGTASNLPLGAPGSNTPISILVTSQNGVDSKTYTVTVHRAASDDSNLSELTVSLGTLNPTFVAGTILYTVDVATNVESVIVSATKSDLNAVMQVHSVTVPAGTGSGQDTITLGGPGTDTPASITVTAQNGIDSKTYTVTIHRAASDDNNLSALSLTAGTIPLDVTPPFDRNHLDYTVETLSGVFEVTVTATKSDPNAVLSGSVPDPGAGVATGQANVFFIFLPPPQISITVTAPDGSHKTYFVTVNQAPELPSP